MAWRALTLETTTRSSAATAVARCPLYLAMQTLLSAIAKSALCQKRTSLSKCATLAQSVDLLLDFLIRVVAGNRVLARPGAGRRKRRPHNTTLIERRFAMPDF